MARGLSVRQVLRRVLTVNLVLAGLAAASLTAGAGAAASLLAAGVGVTAILLRDLAAGRSSPAAGPHGR